MSNFIVEFPMITEKFQEDVLSKRFEVGRKIYNSLINITKKRYNELIKTKKYKSIKLEISELYKKDNPNRRTELYKELNELYKECNLTEYSLHKDVKGLQKHFKTNIDSTAAQKLASNLWRAYEKLLFDEGERLSYKKYGELNSLEGKSNKTGIRFKENKLLWNNLKIRIKIDNNNNYERESLRNDIAYCRIVRKFIRSKNKYYLQIVFKGEVPKKITKQGKPSRYIGSGDVGLDIGTQTIAISSEKDVKIYELCDRVQNIENEKRRIQRKLDRSRRGNNPQNYNEDRKIKKQGNKKVKWIKSNR